jgi:ribosomal protein S3
VVKQVYVLRKDNRKAKNSDLNLCVTEPGEVLGTSTSSAQTIEKSTTNILGIKYELRMPNVTKVKKDVSLSKLIHNREAHSDYQFGTTRG